MDSPDAAWRRAIDVDSFRGAFPGMVLRPGGDVRLRMVGDLAFRVPCGDSAIEDTYELDLLVPRAFPRELPRVFERGGRVPATFHTNPDGSLCLGSPLRLLRSLATQPTLIGFADRCLVPYLYAHTHKERTGKLPWDDLAHGDVGLLQDYLKLFRARYADEVVAFLHFLAMRRRVANKLLCPCRSGRRLGRCHASTLSPFRRVWSRRRFRTERDRMRKHIAKVRRELAQEASHGAPSTSQQAPPTVSN